MNPRRVLRYEIPVDDRWHTLELPRGPIVHVAARQAEVVEFWLVAWVGDDWLVAWVDDDPPITLTRTFRVFGTGQPIASAGYQHVGTAVTADGALAWHLFECSPPEQP